MRAQREERAASSPAQRGDRAPGVAEGGPVDVVTARAVAALPRLVTWCRGLLRPGTRLVALVGARTLGELPDLVPQLEREGMRHVEARAVGAALGEAATTVVVMTR